MSSHHRTLVLHTFQGGRFSDHGIDVAVLEDLLRFQKIVLEVAKDLWRRRNPDRQRLPHHFSEGASLKFYEIRKNCATIPLERVLVEGEQGTLFVHDDEFDDAVELVRRTVKAAGTGHTLPGEFPKALLQLFEQYGTTLRPDEWIEFRKSENEAATRYDHNVRQSLIDMTIGTYEDFVDLVGAVTMARVTRPKMAIQLDNGDEIEAAFSPADEETITTALKEHSRTKVRIVGRGQFSENGQLNRIIAVSSVGLLSAGELPLDSDARSIWDEFAEIADHIPVEELKRLPSDGASRLDHYLYGV